MELVLNPHQSGTTLKKNMEIVRVLGVDASLRNTGLCVLTYNTELSPKDPKALTTSHCQVIVNPAKYTGTDAILNMLDTLSEEAQKDCYQNVDTVLVESPPAMFNKKFPSSVVASIAHISGGAVAIFGIQKSHLFRPCEWNRSRKKDITHSNTVSILGDPDDWHYEKRLKSEKTLEHILDAASMALWWIQANFVEE